MEDTTLQDKQEWQKNGNVTQAFKKNSLHTAFFLILAAFCILWGEA